jgi:hypothetical protein
MRIETVVAVQIVTAVVYSLLAHSIDYRRGEVAGYKRARAHARRVQEWSRDNAR